MFAADPIGPPGFSPIFVSMNLLILALGLFLSTPVHEFFVSICTIQHDVKEKRLQITWRMTTHDVEFALAPRAGGKKLQFGSELELPGADTLLQNYLIENLLIEIDGEPVVIEFLGRDVEMEDMYCYLEVKNVKPFKTLTVNSTLLFETFDEQENVVHLETLDGTLTNSFKQNSLPYTFMVR